MLAAVAVLVVYVLGRASVGGGSSTSVLSPRSAIVGVGPLRTVRGVPAGYAHTRAGALAAALNYIGVLGDPAVLFNTARVGQALSVLAIPPVARLLMADYRRAVPTLERSSVVQSMHSGAPAVAMGVPVAYRVLRGTRDRLTAQFWTVSVIGDVQGIAPEATWARSTATFGWVDGDWKLIARLEHQRGPTPTLARTAQPTQADAFIAALRGFRDFRYAP